MNVLVGAPEYPPNVIGGGGAVYAQIAEYLAREGHDVTVVFGDFTNKSWFTRTTEGVVRKGLRTISVPLVPNPKRANWMLSAMPPTPLAAAQVLLFLRRRKWDVAHFHGVGFPLVDLCAAVARRHKIPYVFTVHGIPNSPFKRSWAVRLAVRAYLRAATRRTLEGAAQTTAVSAALLNDRDFPIADGKVIGNGIDWGGHPRNRSVPDHRDGTLRLLSVSRLSANKGIDITIRAVANLAHTRAVRYDIYGIDGGDERSFRELAQSLCTADSIRFCGAFDPVQREELFSRYDALLMPSRIEGFGLAALEALAAGLPVIANPVDGLGEFLTDENALLVRGEEPRRWSEALETFARNRHAAEARAAAGRASARDHRWERILGLYEHELHAAAAGADSRYARLARAAI